MLKGSGNCRIRGRIISKMLPDVDSSYTADFYEYGNFINQTGNGDPLESIIVTASQPFCTTNGPDEFFLCVRTIISCARKLEWNVER